MLLSRKLHLCHMQGLISMKVVRRRDKFQVNNFRIGPDATCMGSRGDARLRGCSDILQLYINGKPRALVTCWTGDTEESKFSLFLSIIQRVVKVAQ